MDDEEIIKAIAKLINSSGLNGADDLISFIEEHADEIEDARE